MINYKSPIKINKIMENIKIPILAPASNVNKHKKIDKLSKTLKKSD